MSIQKLTAFWNKNKKQIGKAFAKGMDELAQVLQPAAEDIGIKQQVQGEFLLWPSLLQ